MQTHRLVTLDIDRHRLERELEIVSSFEWSEAYSNFVCGGPWLSCMLWTVGGAAGDGVVAGYDQSATVGPTPYAEQLPYLRSIVEETFRLDRLTFARLALLRPGCVIIPHRDLLELDAPLHRVHVPLVTHDGALFANETSVYRMRFGELWFFDAAEPHSAACFSRDRIHLLLDFESTARPEDITRHASRLEDRLPLDAIVNRPPLKSAQRATIEGLAAVLDLRNIRDIVAVVTKQNYRSDGGKDYVWSTLMRIADLAPDQEAAHAIRQMYRYFLVERAD